MGLRVFPLVQWAERAGNSVPRFHVTWGTGPGVIEPFVRRVTDAVASGEVWSVRSGAAWLGAVAGTAWSSPPGRTGWWAMKASASSAMRSKRA